MLRVLLDATAIPPDRRGVGRQLDSLVPALARAGVDLHVLCRPGDAEHFGALSGQDPVVAPPATDRRAVRLAWEQAGLPRRIAALRPDVLHSPHYTHPLVARVPLVVTIHDVTFFTDPDVHLGVKRVFFQQATRLSLRRAACCLVPSQATADELVRVVGADPDRLVVAYHGVDRELFHPPAEPEVTGLRAELGLRPGQGYVAFLGTLEPRKNLVALIDGWVRASARRADPPALVLAGGSGWDDRLAAAAAAVPPELSLLRPGYLPVESLRALFGGALVTAYPSLAEGFGLPVLEAMACGSPVLTTRRTALPEVGGDAVAYTDVDAASIGAALRSLLDDPARRAELAAAGVTRAAGFSWDACAQAHVAAYERAVAVGVRPWRAR